MLYITTIYAASLLMYIVLGNYLLLQEISVDEQLMVWISVLLLVSAALYFLLKNTRLPNKDIYEDDYEEYVPGGNIKFRPYFGNEKVAAIITETTNAEKMDVSEQGDKSPPVTAPAVEYIAVARSRAQGPGLDGGTAKPISQPIFEEKTPGHSRFLINKAMAENVTLSAPAEESVSAEFDSDPAFSDEPIAEHAAEHMASVEHIAVDYTAEPLHITEQSEAADDEKEQNTEVTPDNNANNEQLIAKLTPDLTGNQLNADIYSVLNALSDIIFEYDEQKRCVNLWYNKSQPSVVNLELFRGKTVTEAMGTEKAKVINDALDFVTANQKPVTIEFPSFYGPGKWFKSRISPVFDDRYTFTGHITSLVSDNTEQRRLDAKLQQKQLLMAAAQKIARLGNWVHNVISKETSWSDNLYALLDIIALPLNTTHFEYYVSHVIADDRRSVYQFFADITGEKHLINYHRVITDSGTLKYFRIVRGEPFKDAQGSIIRTTGIIQDVSESQETEQAIRKTQAELFDAQAIAKIGHWKWYSATKELILTDELYKIHEVKPTILDKADSPFKLLLSFVHPEDKTAVINLIKNPVPMCRLACEYRITVGGKLKYLCIIIAKVNQHWDGRIRTMTGTLQDITARKEAELKQNEDNYKLVLESIKLAAVSLDKKGDIIFCNKHLAALLGYEQQELIGLNWYDYFISANLVPVFKEWYQSNNFKPEYVSPIICRNGEERVISWQNTTLYDNEGYIRQTTSIGEDVTNQQKDREFLISEKEKAERSSLSKSEFMSVMSPKIRTPINAVIGITNLLLQDNPRPDQLENLNNLKYSGENLLAIIDDILEYNKIEIGKLELNKTTFDIHQLAANVKQTFLAKALEKKLEILVKTDEDIPENLLGDPKRLGQILNNLFSNAIKFTREGVVTLRIREELRDDKHIKLSFTVADTGVGIDEKDLQKIFEPFQQQPQHCNPGGTGLGLAIIKRLVELHGGAINVQSTVGEGSQFTFTIDFEYNAEPATKTESVIPISPGTDLNGMKVLVVDDNKLNMLIARRFLDKWRVATNEASDGYMATEMVDKNYYDLVLMDLQMPVMDGFDAVKIIKQKHPALPIIALTADAVPETFSKTVEYGFDDYLVKPFIPNMLFEKVSKFFKGV